MGGAKRNPRITTENVQSRVAAKRIPRRHLSRRSAADDFRFADRGFRFAPPTAAHIAALRASDVDAITRQTNLRIMTTTLSADGLIEIPETFRKADALKPGQRCEIERVGQGEYRLSVDVVATGASGERLIDVLLDCPVKDWWTEPERTERTSLQPPPLFSE